MGHFFGSPTVRLFDLSHFEIVSNVLTKEKIFYSKFPAVVESEIFKATAEQDHWTTECPSSEAIGVKYLDVVHLLAYNK